MTEPQIRDFIAQQGAACTGSNCLRSIRVNMTDQPADAYFAAVAGGTGLDAAAVITRVSVACGVNPRVMLVTLQKESRLLNRTDPTPGCLYRTAFAVSLMNYGPLPVYRSCASTAGVSPSCSRASAGVGMAVDRVEG
jgi:hypothetical protein